MAFFRRVAPILLLLLVLSPIPSKAEDGVLRVALDPFPPWKYLNSIGEPCGMDVDFIDVLAKRMGLKVEYFMYPFSRALYLLEYGEADMMSGVLRREEREAYLHFLQPPYKEHSDKAFYMLRGRKDLLQKYDDLHRLRIGTQNGTSYFPVFDHDPKISKIATHSFELNLRMLLANRIDAVINTEVAGDFELSKLGLQREVVKAPYIYREKQDVYIVLSKKSPLADRLDEFNTVMADLVREGAFQRIVTRYIHEAQKH
ncbi:transporter substrate-binding domain-containing protein [uncultured Pseudodesulfovibrio sp.]|uniref:substrate-binding periplasmic protein n=1 Tax=uncultured Pseudodesulfovibrio sp. TaxID=2035858 RepID=UPI0029C72FAA|nr:transporter substrate-binding domain-containing protein [uncultured Pseudodesulfovibrio sp.]